MVPLIEVGFGCIALINDRIRQDDYGNVVALRQRNPGTRMISRVVFEQDKRRRP